MNIRKATVRERLIGMDLVGFDTRAAVVRAPTAKAGEGVSRVDARANP